MERDEAISLDAVLELAKKLPPPEKLKLVQHVLAELTRIIQGKKPRGQISLRGSVKGGPLTEEEIAALRQKLWGTARKEEPGRVVQL